MNMGLVLPNASERRRQHQDCIAFLGSVHARDYALNRRVGVTQYIRNLKVYWQYLSNKDGRKKNNIQDLFLMSITKSIQLNELVHQKKYSRDHPEVRDLFSGLKENDSNSFLLFCEYEDSHAYGKVFRKIKQKSNSSSGNESKIHEVCINKGWIDESNAMYAYIDHDVTNNHYLDTKISTKLESLDISGHEQVIGNCQNIVARNQIEYVFATREGLVKSGEYKKMKRIIAQNGDKRRIHQVSWKMEALKNKNSELIEMMAWHQECKDVRKIAHKNTVNLQGFTLDPYPLVKQYGIDLKTYLKFEKNKDFLQVVEPLLKFSVKKGYEADFLKKIEKKYEGKWKEYKWNGKSYMSYFFEHRLDHGAHSRLFNHMLNLLRCLRSENQVIQEYAELVLKRALNKYFGNQERFGENGGMEVLVKCLRSKSQIIQEYAIRALINTLGENPGNQKRFGERGGIDALIKCLGSRSQKLQKYVIRALMNALGENPGNQKHFGERGGIDALIKCLGSRSQKLQEYTIMALMNALGENPGNQKRFGEKGGIAALIKCLGSKNQIVQEYAILALWMALEKNPGNQKRLRENRDIEALIKCLGSKNWVIKRHAKQILKKALNFTQKIKRFFNKPFGRKKRSYVATQHWATIYGIKR